MGSEGSVGSEADPRRPKPGGGSGSDVGGAVVPHHVGRERVLEVRVVRLPAAGPVE